MIEQEQAISDLLEIYNGRKHKHYQRTVELAKFYNQIISGENLDDLLKQFDRREDKDSFDQRKAITKEICSSVSSGVIKTFRKIFRVTPAVRSIEYRGDDATIEKSTVTISDRKDDLEKALSEFYGHKGLDMFMKDRFVDLTFSDPNAFVVVEIDEFDSKVEKAKPRPWEVSSAMAVDFSMSNNKLEYLAVKVPIKYMDQEVEKEGRKIYLYLADWTYTLETCAADHVPEDGERITTNEERQEYGVLNQYEHKAGRVPATRIGYETDTYTMGESYVGPLHCAKGYYEKMIKAVSEMDLTMSLHAFPQKLQYVEPCRLDANGVCSTSREPVSSCSRCGGAGHTTHKSAQEVITLKMPRHSEDMINLEELLTYKYPPIDLIKFQKDYIEMLTNKVHKTVFNSEIFTKDEVANTATGKNLDMQNVYDTLSPFADQVSETWIYMVELIAIYTDNFKNLLIAHRYPQDFKLKGVAELLDELAKANESKASGYVKQGITRDLLRAMNQDNPVEYQKIFVKEKFFPFNGKTESEISQIIANKLASRRTLVLWANFDKIFDDLESEFLNREEPVYFYDLSYDMQEKALEKALDVLLDGLNSETPRMDKLPREF